MTRRQAPFHLYSCASSAAVQPLSSVFFGFFDIISTRRPAGCQAASGEHRQHWVLWIESAALADASTDHSMGVSWRVSRSSYNGLSACTAVTVQTHAVP